LGLVVSGNITGENCQTHQKQTARYASSW